MKLFNAILVGIIFSLPATGWSKAVEGGEIGNAFVPFDSKIGKFSLEYAKSWRLNDLAPAASFADATAPSITKASFFYIATDSTLAANTLLELAENLSVSHPQIIFNPLQVAGVLGFEGIQPNGVKLMFLLRAPGDVIAVRLHSSDGERSEEVLSHMLNSLRLN